MTRIRLLCRQLQNCRCIFESQRWTTSSSATEDDQGASRASSRAGLASAALGSAILVGYFWQRSQKHQISADMQAIQFPTPAAISEKALEPPMREELPIFTRKDVAVHKNKETGIWVTYKNGVYDITEFVDGHPGGNKILLAAGSALEPFWNIYAQHKNSQVMEIIEELRIGNLDPKEARETKSENDPFVNDPERHPALIPRSDTPFNAETPPTMLLDNFHTPNDIFYVRNHLPCPKIDLDTYKLKLFGLSKEQELSLEELKTKFGSVSFSSAIQCGGNRRSGMAELKEVKGLRWQNTAIGNATWTGVRLADVLMASGLLDDVKSLKRKHVRFQGLDKDMSGQHYETSVPLEAALHPEVIIAFQMNGEPLPLDHGYPLRLIVPGVVGARQVKWLHRIEISDEESISHWQRQDYRVFSPSEDFATVDYTTAPAIQEAPVQSAICEPVPGTKLDSEEDEVELKGYAWSGGGRGIIRVDVSIDGGKTWQAAKLQQDPEQPLNQMWAWTLWSAVISIPEEQRKPGSHLTAICKAVDSSYNVQPETPAGIWNFRGLLNNSWSRVDLDID